MTIQNSKELFALLSPLFNPECEELWVVALNSQLQIIQYNMLFRGTINGCLVHPRDIFRFVFIHNASSFAIAHNHPSLSIEPSNADIKFTHNVNRLARLHQIMLIDHIIFTHNNYFSFSENSLLTSPRRRQTQKDKYPILSYSME